MTTTTLLCYQTSRSSRTVGYFVGTRKTTKRFDWIPSIAKFDGHSSFIIIHHEAYTNAPRIEKITITDIVLTERGGMERCFVRKLAL
jgi:hypothetical protein